MKKKFKMFGENGILNGKRAVSLSLAAAVAIVAAGTVYAEGNALNSNGRIEFDNGTPDDPSDDVVFDSADLTMLDGKIDAALAEVSSGKEAIASALNTGFGWNEGDAEYLSSSNSFADLSGVISGHTYTEEQTVSFEKTEENEVSSDDYSCTGTVKIPQAGFYPQGTELNFSLTDNNKAYYSKNDKGTWVIEEKYGGTMIFDTPSIAHIIVAYSLRGGSTYSFFYSDGFYYTNKADGQFIVLTSLESNQFTLCSRDCVNPHIIMYCY